MFFIKSTLISLNKILSRDESLLPAPRTLSRGTVSRQAHPPALWEDPAQISEVLPVLMSHGLGAAGAGAWPGVVGGQPPCRGRKQCCWLYSQSSSGAQRILSSLQGLVFHSMWHKSHSKSYRRLWLCISTRPKDYVRTHPRCLFLEGRHSACQLSLGRGLFAKNDGWWEFRISIWFSFLNLNIHQKFSDYGEVIWMYTLCTIILLFLCVKVKKLEAEKSRQTQHPNVVYNLPLICMPLPKTNALMYFMFHGYELPWG